METFLKGGLLYLMGIPVIGIILAWALGWLS